MSPELKALIARAKEKAAAMSPDEKRAMLRAQRRSWAIGELMLQHEGLTREEAARRIDLALEEMGEEI